MKSLLFLFLISCSSVKSPTPASPASPYTVDKCYCMKIFSPVCAQGINYGNSCEAECQGHKTWTEGRCDSTTKK